MPDDHLKRLIRPFPDELLEEGSIVKMVAHRPYNVPSRTGCDPICIEP